MRGERRSVVRRGDAVPVRVSAASRVGGGVVLVVAVVRVALCVVRCAGGLVGVVLLLGRSVVGVILLLGSIVGIVLLLVGVVGSRGVGRAWGIADIVIVRIDEVLIGRAVVRDGSGVGVHGFVPEGRHTRSGRGLSFDSIDGTFGVEEGVAGAVVSGAAPTENHHEAREDSNDDEGNYSKRRANFALVAPESRRGSIDTVLGTVV